MKKNKLYTVTKHNRPAFMPDINYFASGGNARWDLLASQAYGANYGDPGYTLNDYKQSKNILGISKENNPFSKGNIGNTMTTVGKGLAVAAPRQLFDTFDPVYHLAGGRESAIGNGLSETGVGLFKAGAQSGNGALMLAGAGAKVLGGLWNGAFGIKENKENIDYIKNNTNTARNIGQTIGAASNNNDLLSMAGGMVTDSGFAWNDLYKNGWLTRKGTRKGNKLVNAEDAAIAYQNHAFVNAANQVDRTQDDLAQSTFIYSDGGGIHIDPSKKGTFTAAASKHGMGVQEFASKVLANKEDYSPTMVKKANFAKNAAKWHDYGGPLNYLNTGALGIMQNDKYLDAINHRSDVLAKNAGVQYSSYTPGTFAFGGELGTNGTDWTNGLLYVDAGGTHQQNPLGGVPVGFDQNGTPNLVEEGETIWNDYVFSNRINVPKAMFHTLGLGGAMKKNRLTFADASKKLAKESEQRPNDPISMAGLESSLSKLAAVQEAERMKKQMRESVGLENMAAYGGPVNKFKDGGSLEWLKKNHPEIKHIEEVAKAMDRYIKQHPSRIRMKGDVVPYMNAYSLIANGAGNLLSPREMPAENSPVSNSRVTTGIIYGNEAAREQHFQDLIDLGLSKEAALDLSYPEPELKKSKSPNTQSANEVEYAEQMDRRNRFQERMYSAVDNNTRELPEPSSEYVSNYSNAHRAIQNSRGISTPLLTLDPISIQQPVESEPQVQLQGIEPDVLADVRTNAERNYLAGFTPNELAAFNNMTPAQRQAVLRQAPQESSARNIPSNDTGYTGTSGVRSQNGIIPYGYYTNGSDGLGEPTGFTVGKNGLIDTQNGYTQEYRDLVKKLTADDIRKWVEAHPNDPSYLSFKNRGNDITKLTDEQWRTGALDGKYGFMHHVADSILKGDYTPTSAMEDPGKIDRLERTTLAGSPNTDVTIKNPLEHAAGAGNNTRTNNIPQDEFNPLPTWMRYAPVVGGAVSVLGDMLGLTNKPDYTYADKLEAAANAAGYAPTISPQPIGDYIRYNPFDRLFYANQLQANARATDRALANTSSPSRAAGLLANAYNTTNSLGNLYRQGDEYNLAQRQQTADFNRRTNMFNSQMGLEAAMANARYRQAAKQYQLSGLAQAASLRNAIDQRVGAARSANLTNLFNSIGDIGRENMSFNMVNSTSAANNGYWIDKKGVVHYTNRDKKE